MRAIFFAILTWRRAGILALLFGAALVALLFANGRKSLELHLQVNLGTLRDTIDQYHGDKAEYPHELLELVREGYLRSIPFDPMTGRSDLWMLIYSCRDGDSSPGGIYDVRTTSTLIGSNGKPYSAW
jgi:general secretion pathway protein G